MATVVYDDYGRTSDDPDFGSRSETREPYIVDAAGVGVIYICFCRYYDALCAANHRS